jgi:hypothetical protein
LDTTAFIQSGILEEYVLGIASKDDIVSVEAMRSQYPAVESYIVAFEEQIQRQFEGSNVQMSVSASTDKNMAAFFAKNTVQNLPSEAAKIVPLFNWKKLAVAASLLLLAGSLFYNYKQHQTNVAQQAVLAAAKKSLPEADYAVLNNPNITPVGMYGQGIHAVCRCTLFWDKEKNKAYVMIHHLVSSGESQNYVLWVNVNGKPVNVGVIDENIRGKFVELNNVPQESDSFLVTLETNDKAQTPNDDIFLKGVI